MCKEGKDEFVHSEQMSLNLELLQPVADTLGSSLRSGEGGGGEAGEMWRETKGWRDDEGPASPDGFVSLAGGWLRRRQIFFFFFFLVEG